MSIGGAEKEFIFHLWLKTRKERFEQVLGIRLGNIQLEQPLEDHRSSDQGSGKRKPVDMHAMDTDFATPVLVESVLGQSNAAHQEKVQRLINYLDAGAVVYQAFSFQDKHVMELRNLIETSGKPIRLYLVEINPDLLLPLTELDRMNKLDVYHSLGILDEVAIPIQVVETIEYPTFRMIQPQQIPCESGKLSSRLAVNKFLIRELERSIPEFFAFHRGKSRLENRIMSFGAGASPISYHCSAKDSRGYAFVELRFGDRDYLFNLFTIKRNLLEKSIDRRVYVGDNCIGVEFKASPDPRGNVRKLVKIFKAMIQGISRPLYDLLSFEHEVKAIRKRRTA